MNLKNFISSFFAIFQIQGINSAHRPAPAVEQRTSSVTTTRASEHSQQSHSQAHAIQHNHNSTTQQHSPQIRNVALESVHHQVSNHVQENGGRALSPQPRNGHRHEGSSPQGQSPHKYPLMQFAARHFRHPPE